jgi:hypothetical protein
VSASSHDEIDESGATGFEHDVDEDELVDSGFEDVSAQRPMMHDGIPITGWFKGEPIPDLNALPQDRWMEVLRPLSHWPRTHATATLRTVDEARVAATIKGRLLLEGRPRGIGPVEDAPPRMPDGAPPARGAGRQINFRLGPDEHARLAEAAELFAMRPTALARVLTMRGVNRVLYEERRDR